jgi:hypothetical protein
VAERGPFPLPLRIEDIEKTWLTAALQTRAPHVHVGDFEIVDINHGTATKVRIRLDVDAAGRQAGIPASVILKGGFEPHSRQMALTYAREGRGYRDVLPVLDLRTPACYFAGVDPEGPQTIVIMEDLVARGVRFCDPLQPQTYEQVERRLSALARFHAQTWDSPEFQPGGRWDWVHDGAGMFRTYMEQAGYFQPEVWDRFVNLPRGAAVSVVFHDLDWARLAVDRLATMAAGLPQCIVHGDTHLGNLYEELDGAPGFFDIAFRRECPHFEISYHITCALDQRDRPRWEEALVRHYLDELSRHGVEPPELDETMSYFGRFLTLGYLIFLVNESHYQTEAVNTAYAARFSAAMLDHHTLGLVGS